MSRIRPDTGSLFRLDRYLVGFAQSRVGLAVREGLDRVGLWQAAKAPVSALRRWMEAHESYDSKVQRENAYFSALNVEQVTAENWMSIPGAYTRINRLLGAVQGEADDAYFLQWARRHTGPIAGVGVDIGCGPGFWPRRLIDAGLAQRFEALDVAEGWIDQARADPRNDGYDINFFVADINKRALEPERYALVFVHDAMHHILQLETVIDRMVSSLQPGGWLLLCDYVGPSRMQWSDAQLQAANALLSLLPTDRRRMTDGVVKRSIRRPDPSFLSPFEAIRSAEILPLLDRHARLTRVEVRRYLGLLPLIASGIAHHLMQGDEAMAHYLDLVTACEDYLEALGSVPGNFAVALYRKTAMAADAAGGVP